MSFMKKRTSKLTALLLAATMIAAGCGFTANAEESVSGELSILSWYSESEMQAILDGFTAQYPDVTVDLQHVSSENSQYAQKLTLLANAGELPDLFYVQPPINLMASNGYLADLSELEVVKALPEGYRSSYSYEGGVYAYCPDAWVGGVFYNKTIFAEHNLEVPTTYGEFLDICKTLSEAGVQPLAVNSDAIIDYVFWIHNTEVLSKDLDFNNKIDTGEVTFEEGFLEALTIFKEDLVDTGYIGQDAVGTTDDQRMTEFAMGDAAMTISGPWAVATFQEKNPDLDFSIFPYVGSEGEVLTIGALNVAICMNSAPKNQAAAEAFLTYLGSDEGLLLYQEMTGNFLGVDSVEYEINPVMEPIVECAKTGAFAYPSVTWEYQATLGDMLIKGVQEIILETTTPEELVQALDAKQAELSGNN